MIKKTNLGEKKSKLVYGVGINDADYIVQLRETIESCSGKPRRKLIWSCPFYSRWVNMLQRCYSEKYQQLHPSYVDCVVVEEWKTFSNFKAWMETQDWKGKHLDKDLLFNKNKVYGPDTCLFVREVVNKFLNERDASRGEFPIGVNWDNNLNKFRSTCRNPFTGKKEHLGLFSTAIQAHHAWRERKQQLAKLLAAIQTDPRIAKALVDRYMSP